MPVIVCPPCSSREEASLSDMHLDFLLSLSLSLPPSLSIFLFRCLPLSLSSPFLFSLSLSLLPFSSLSYYYGRNGNGRRKNLTCSTTRKENEKLDRKNTEPSGATFFLMYWKMCWTTTIEWTALLTTGGKFLRKSQTKKKHCSSVASRAPLLHPQSKNLPRQATQTTVAI